MIVSLPRLVKLPAFNIMKLVKPGLPHKSPILSRMILLSWVLLFATTAVAQQQSAQELLSQADEVLQQMSQLTGLRITGQLNKQIVSRPEVEKIGRAS